MTPTFVSYASSKFSGGVTSKPAGVVAGHVLVAFSASSGAPTTPSGWTLQKSENYGGSGYLACYTKVAGGSEPSTYTFVAASSVIETIIEAWSGSDTASIITGTPTSIQAASTNPVTLPSLTTVGANAVLVMGAFVYALGSDGTGVAVSGGGTERREENDTNTYLLAAHDELRASAGASGTRTITAAGALASSYLIIGIMIALKNGQVNVNIAGEVAAVGVIGVNGAITATKNVAITGQVAAIGITGIDGSISAIKNVSISGQVAAISIAGLDGSISVTRNISITGQVAAVSISGLDGVPSAVKNVSIAGEVAAISMAGIDGAATAIKNVSISGQVAGVGIVALDGAISAIKNVSISGALAAISIGAPDGVLSVTRNISISGQVAGVGIVALDGVASAIKNVSISGQVAAISIAGLNGSISAIKNVSIAGQIAAITIGAIEAGITAEMLEVPGFLLRESIPEPLILDRAAIEKDLLLAREIIAEDVILNRVEIEKDLLLALDSGIEPIRMITIDGDSLAS